ncbi:hypothetical protein [Phenylobacterium sp.]|jgi:hypothetical protein|uniref:hypothetical protein n=1 Tax=Phenylobacterium sp. TaxID=1871053 RepID=UPI002F3F4BE2
MTTDNPPLSPVAWRVKDFADGWILCHSEAQARREAEGAGNLVQPLYIHTDQDRIAELLKPKIDEMIDRSEEEWDALEDATMQVYGFKEGRTLSADDIAALSLVDSCHRNDDEAATDAHHRGWLEGLRERGGDELVKLNEVADEASIARATEYALRRLAEVRAEAAASELQAAKDRIAELEDERNSALREMTRCTICGCSAIKSPPGVKTAGTPVRKASAPRREG